MRKTVLYVLIALCTITVAFGQQENKITPPKGISEQVKKRVISARDRLVVDLCMMNAIVKKDGGVTVPNDFKLNAFNRGINVYFMYDVAFGKKKIVKNFSIAPGIGVGSENYYFKNYKLTWHYDSLTRFKPLGDSVSSKNSKLNMTYIDIPIELRYRSEPNKKTGMSWKIAVGFKFGFLVGSKWKYKGEDPNRGTNGESVTIKDIGVANMSKFRYGPTIRGGYGPVSLFAYYSIGSAFTTKGPKMNPIVFGISINGL